MTKTKNKEIQVEKINLNKYELSVILNKDDMEQLSDKGYIDCLCDISIRIKTPKKFINKINIKSGERVRLK